MAVEWRVDVTCFPLARFTLFRPAARSTRCDKSSPRNDTSTTFQNQNLPGSICHLPYKLLALRTKRLLSSSASWSQTIDRHRLAGDYVGSQDVDRWDRPQSRLLDPALALLDNTPFQCMSFRKKEKKNLVLRTGTAADVMLHVSPASAKGVGMLRKTLFLYSKCPGPAPVPDLLFVCVDLFFSFFILPTNDRRLASNRHT